MKRLECNKSLPFLTQEQRVTLTRLSHSLKWMPHELKNLAGLTHAQVLTVFTHLENIHLSETYLLIYHSCTEEIVATRFFRDGFPSFPWHCPYCDEEVFDGDELSFDIMAKLNESIEFIDAYES